MPINDSIGAAIQNIAAFGDTDIFPFPFENHLFNDRPELVQASLEALHRDFDAELATHPPDNINTLSPIGYTGFRWATQIDPIWNAYYLALVIELGPAIERERIPTLEQSVFSYRFVPPCADGSIFDSEVNWHSFMKTCLKVAEDFPHVIVCDVADFYYRVYHHRIENALKWLRTPGDEVKRIMDMLGVFSGTVSYGLPVGGPASRLLAELALNGVDKQLRSGKARFCRYVDDYRIFCASKEEAYQRLIFLSEKLANEGLSLQRSKTRILTADEFRREANLLLKAEQVEEEKLTEEEKLLRLTIRFDPYSETRVDDYRQLKEEISKVDVAAILARELEKTRIDSVVTKQAISALRVVDPEPRRRILGSLLQQHNLSTLAPVFPRLMTVLRGLYSELDEKTQDLVDEALIALVDEGSHLIKLDLNLAYLVQVLRRRSTQRKEELFVKLFGQNTSPLVRREIILAMTEWGHNYWLTDLRKRFNGLSRWERRCFIVASYYLTDEGKHWRDHTKSSFERSEIAVRDWFKDRYQRNTKVPQ
jgi:hypothetical protein